MGVILFNLFGVAGLIIFGFMLYNAFFRLPRLIKSDKSPSMQFYLYKISRVTGHSEYDVFCKSAEDWPVSQARVDQDFDDYLSQQTVPHYVNDFVRRNKHHIDELQIPRF